MEAVRALDELHYGPQRTLNLRDSLPSATEATRRADRWLREQQVKGHTEVLIVTGRGNQSVGGVPIVKQAVLRVLGSLRRQGVVASHREHNPGALAVTLAPIRAMADAPARRREPRRAPRAFDFSGLGDDSTRLLRHLAEAALADLAITADDARVRDEMHRQLGVIVSASPAAAQDEEQLRAMLRAMLAEYD